MQEASSFTAFWRTLLRTPRTFFRQHLAPEAPRPYWWVVTSLFFSWFFVESQHNLRSSADFEHVIMSDNYYKIQVMLLVGSLLIGLLMYFLSGWVMKLVILICGGKANVKQSRSIVLYTSAVTHMLSLLFLTGCLCGYLSFSMSVVLSNMIVVPYQGYMRYCAVMTLPGANKGRVIFFFILPILLLSFVGFLSMLKVPKPVEPSGNLQATFTI